VHGLLYTTKHHVKHPSTPETRPQSAAGHQRDACLKI
jgi:hypothetical protein